jgi:hypothetical protein
MTIPQHDPFACPNCHRIEMVQKVSAIVDAGTLVGTGFGAGFSSMGRTQSVLSKRLSLPKPHRLDYVKPTAIPFLIGWGICFFAVSIFLLIQENAEDAVIGMGIVFLLLLPGSLGAYLVQRALAARAMPAWERAYPTWQRLYYCARCDGVFLPGGDSPLIPSHQMRAFVSQ